MTQNNLGNALRRLASGRTGRRVWRRRFRPIARRFRKGRASGCRCNWAQDAEQSRQCAYKARRAGERDGASGGGGCGLSRGAGGTDARAGPARLGHDAEQSRHCASALGERESGTARLEEAVAAYREALRKGRASASRWTGPRRRTISAMRFKRWASGRAGRRVLRRRLRPIARHLRRGRATGSRCTGRRRRTISAMHSTDARRAGSGDGQSEGLRDAEDGAGSLCGGAGGISEGGRELLCGGDTRQCCAARWRHRRLCGG